MDGPGACGTTGGEPILTKRHPGGSWERTAPIIATIGLIYFVVLGGTPAGDISPVLRTFNAVLAAGLIVGYFIRAPQFADRVDRLVLLGLIAFMGACVLSAFLRQSFDAALAAMAYVALLFHLRGELSSPRSRRWMAAALQTLSVGATIVVASIWLRSAGSWTSTTGTLPPLGLDYGGSVWGHRYDAALLLVLLLPSWWVVRPGRIRGVTAAVVGVFTAALTLLSGSRTLWLAIIVASAAIVLPRLWEVGREIPRKHLVGVALAGAALLVLAVAALGPVLWDRLVAGGTITARADMWGYLTGAWLERPVAGYGPGSFAWVLQTTDYFEANSWAPRHPDSVLFQLLPEAGIFGLVAAGTWLVAVAPPVMRSTSLAAKWALVMFAVAGIGTNPSEFGFLLMLAIVWIALAVPRKEGVVRVVGSPTRSRWFRPASAAGLIAVGLAFGSTTVAMHVYSSSRSAIAQGREERASTLLDSAIALDPGMGIYWRQRATIALLDADTASASDHLAVARRLNPLDDLTWRISALASAREGEPIEAAAAAGRAVDIQRSDPTNLLLLAALLAEDQPSDARALISEVAQAWPAVVGATGWSELLPAGVTTEMVISDATDRWVDGDPSIQPGFDQRVWLAALGGGGAPISGVPGNSLSPAMTDAMLAVLRCDPSGGSRLDQLTSEEKRSPRYWAMRIRAASNSEERSEAMRLYGLAASDSLLIETGPLSPIAENGWDSFSTDVWGYRRQPVDWQASGVLLPSPSEGYIRWVLTPAQAIKEAHLEEVLRQC